ncbi:MAG: hypothetical protein RIR00_1769 [Pseudomonadota bacterium]|jgi:uncharacterized membrane-anchored protein YhcB (DUF1043 family)
METAMTYFNTAICLIVTIALAFPKLASLLFNHALSSSLEKYKNKLLQELETYKAKINKELETHKTGLAKELETHKVQLTEMAAEIQRQNHNKAEKTKELAEAKKTAYNEISKICCEYAKETITAEECELLVTELIKALTPAKAVISDKVKKAVSSILKSAQEDHDASPYINNTEFINQLKKAIQNTINVINEELIGEAND